MGSAGKLLKTLVQIFYKLRFIYLLLFIVGTVQLIRLLILQRLKNGPTEAKTLGASKSKRPDIYFVGFGAGPEEALFAFYCAEKDEPVARVDQTKVASMGRWYRIGARQAFASLIHSLRITRHALAHLPHEYRPWEVDFLTFVGIRLGYYSYVRAWFAELKSSSPELAEVCFLAADTAAFSAVNVGIPTRYLQHGLIRHSLVFPAFDRVDALTHDELIHFRKRLPAADVQLRRPKMTGITPVKPPCILVASVYGQHEEMRRILPFLEFATNSGMAIHVRPHPCEDRNFWEAGDLPFNVQLDDSDSSFDDALERLRPTLVVSWFSTALVDALYRSVIPVSVSTRDDLNIKDMVYPLFKHSLHWPSDQHELEEIITCEASYTTTLSRLRVGIE